MGVHVMFEIGAPDGLEGLFWESGPALFRDYLRAVEVEDPGSYSSELRTLLDRIVSEGPSALIPANRQDAEMIDAVFDAFVGDYCDLSATSLLRDPCDSMTNVHWFELVQGQIESHCSSQVVLSWSYLLNGRAVGRPPTPYPYTPSEEVFRLGYWTAEEVRTVRDGLRDGFPAIAQRYEMMQSGRSVRRPQREVAIVHAMDATVKASAEETGPITTVA